MLNQRGQREGLHAICLDLLPAKGVHVHRPDGGWHLTPARYTFWAVWLTILSPPGCLRAPNIITLMGKCLARRFPITVIISKRPFAVTAAQVNALVGAHFCSDPCQIQHWIVHNESHFGVIVLSGASGAACVQGLYGKSDCNTKCHRTILGTTS